MTALYHYTCEERARLITRRGMLRPHAHPTLDGARLVWLTDMSEPDAVALGLTSESLPCDRLAVRYVVEAPDAEPWFEWLARHPDLRGPGLWLAIGRGAGPTHWFVLPRSVLAVRDRTYRRPPVEATALRGNVPC